MANKQSSGKISKRMQQRAEERRKKRTTLLIVAAIVIALMGGILFGVINSANNAPSDTAQEGLPAEIQVDDAYQRVEKGAYLLDVRTPAEWDDFHAPQAELIPLDELENRVNEVPSDQDIVVICNSGNRSQVGRDILLNAGYPNVTSVDGGMQGWRAAGYPTE